MNQDRITSPLGQTSFQIAYNQHAVLVHRGRPTMGILYNHGIEVSYSNGEPILLSQMVEKPRNRQLT